MILVTLGVLILGSPRADACRVVELEFVPTDGLQIVVWLEDSAGNFLDTVFITDLTGRYGLGNRPGMMEFNSQWKWPYGRRTTTFPVWAHRRGVTYPKIIFQDEDDTDLSHALDESSPEAFYCRPVKSDEPQLQDWIDANSCATPVYTDKGKRHPTETSLYPPRNDLTSPTNADHPDVALFADLNDLDAISRATPPGGLPYKLRVALSNALPAGEYVAWIEVSKEFDQNEHYAYPSPTGIAWSDYGEAYRGQPSVVWKVPFLLDTEAHVALATDYAGYGDPDGLDGELNPPDATITTTMEGSGAGRLLLGSSPEGSYRFRVASRLSEGGEDTTPPGAPASAEAIDVAPDQATLRFRAPADDGADGASGKVTGYEIRYLKGEPLTDENFVSAGLPAPGAIVPAEPGQEQTFTLTGLAPESRYWVGIKAQDDCLNVGPLVVLTFDTPRGVPPAVGCGCRVARPTARGSLVGGALIALGLGLAVVRRRGPRVRPHR